MMRTRTAPRRLVAALASVTAAALIAACGGSDIDQAAQNAADPATTQTDAGTAGVPAVPDPAAQAQTDAATDPAGAPAPASGTPTDSAPAPAQPADTTGAGADQAPGTADGAPAAAGQAETGKAGKGKKADGDAAAAANPAAGASGSAVAQLVAGHPVFGGNAPCKPATLSEIPIGNVSTLSGVLGELFSPVVPALNTFVAALNACGGLNGHKMKLFIDDDQGDPSTAVTKVQNMIQNNKILAFVGNIQVLTIDAVVPTIKQAGIPIIGSDVTNNTWFTNPLFFPQAGSQQSVSYGFLLGATEYHKETDVGIIWCIEVPRACEQANRAFEELAPKLGATVKKSVQVSLTQPSFVQQCLDFKNAGVKAIGLILDAASMKRFARSCEQVGWFPKVMAHPLGVGNEAQFLGSKWLGNSYVPLGTFGWMANSTPAEKYYQASVNKYNPGFQSGGAANLGWTSAALLLAASANLSETNPTTQQFLDALWEFQGQKFTELGGLSGPKFYGKDKNPKVPYCIYAAVSNAENTGWASVASKPTCTDIVAPSDPLAQLP